MQKFLEKILFYGLILTLFTPLVIGESLLFPFVSTKAYFFYIVVDVLLIVYLILLSRRPLYPRRSKLLIVFFTISILGIVFNLFGLSFSNSFWGNYERMMGVYNSLHLLVYLWLLLSITSSRRYYRTLLKISVVVSFLLGIYSILQKIGVPWPLIVQPVDNRLIATLGNAAYLAGFALIFLFLTSYLWLKDRNIYWRIFYGLTFVLNLYMLVATATRGALVALAVAIALMLIFILFFYNQKKIKIWSGVILLLFILSSSFIFLFNNSAFIQNNLALRRISQISFSEATVSSRLSLWKMSIQAVQDKPMFGYGENNIRVPLDHYHDYSLTESWFDSSHNKFFDELLAHGIVGFVIQIAFFVWLFWLVFKKRQQDFWGVMLTLGLLTAYIVQALFIFDSFIVSWLFIFVLGFIILNFDRQDAKQKSIGKKQLPIYLGGVLAILLAIFFFYIYNHSIGPATQIVKAEKISEQDLKDKGFVDSLAEIDKLYQAVDDKMFFNYDIFAPSIARVSVDVFENYEHYTDVQLKRHMELMAKIYQQAIDDSGGYSKFYVNLAKMYQLVSKAPRLDYLQQSMDLLHQALEQSPGRIDIYYALAQGYFMQGNFDKAQDILYRALDLGVRQGEVYFRLAQIQSRQGDIHEALDSIARAEEHWRPLTFLELEDLAKIFIEREEWQATANVFIKMVELEPTNTDAYFNVALAYAKLGDRDKAIEWINKVSEVDPSLQEIVDQFINDL